MARRVRGDAGGVEGERQPWVVRRREIDERVGEIHVRLGELSQKRGAGGEPGWLGDRLAAAQRHAVLSEEAARQAAVFCGEAFRGAALAHEHAAEAHERAAAAGLGDVGEHERLAAVHREAAQADRRQAGRAGSLFPGPGPGGSGG